MFSDIIQQLTCQLDLWNVEYRIDNNAILTKNVVICILSHNTQKLNNIDRSVIYLWEDVFANKKEIVFARFQSIFEKNKRIFARKTTIGNISQEIANAFLDSNHLLGATTAKYKLGLFYQEELVALAFWGDLLKFKEKENYISSELIRFVNKKGITVVGGLDKLLKSFISQYQPNDVMTYIDCEWSDGKSFLRLGFEYETTTSPNVFWINTQTMHRTAKNPLSDAYQKIENQGNLKLRLTI